MTRTQYASSITPPAPTLAITGGDITSGTEGTYSFWLYNRNRAGVTLFSDRAEISVAVDQGIQVTIPATVITSGSDIYEIGVVANKDDTNPATGCVVATYPASETLPTNIFLYRDEHFVFFGTVNNIAALPTGVDLINGMRRYIDDLGYIAAYVALDSNWQQVFPQDFNPLGSYFSSRRSQKGCAKRIRFKFASFIWNGNS